MTEQNNKPNFDFIMNQPGSELDKPRKKPKVLFVAVIVVAAAMITLALVVTYSRFAAVDIRPVENNITQYLQYMTNKDASSAYKLTSTSHTQVPEDLFKLIVITFGNRYKGSECMIEKTVYQKPVFTTTVTCPLKQSSKSATITLESQMLENQPKITKVSESL